MTPFVRRFVEDEDYQTFLKIRMVVEKLPDLEISDPSNDNEISCHMLARALKPFFPVVVRDGSFCGYCQHSWLETKTRQIIDVYPVATLGGPILVEATELCCPAKRLYRVQSGSYRGKFSTVEFKQSVKTLRKEIESIISNFGLL